MVFLAIFLFLIQLVGCSGDSTQATPGNIQMGGSIQGTPLSIGGGTSTLAGDTLTGSQDGIGEMARFYNPAGITTDGTNLYVADTSNHTIRQVIIATGAVTTLAGAAGSSGSSDGIGAAARFLSPTNVTTDGTNLFVTDTYNNTIRQVVIASGAVTTLAGAAGTSGSTDGIGASARFSIPTGITTDGSNLYVADTFNNTIRQVVIATGAVMTLAGSAGSSGFADGTGAAARFNGPYGITTDGRNLFLVDTWNNTIRQIVITTGAVTTLSGTVGSAGSADGIGTAASFYNPYGITSDGTNLFVTDTSNQTIRRAVIATGAVTTLAGTAGSSGSVDGTGAAARFYNPAGITTDGASLFVVDCLNYTIRTVN